MTDRELLQEALEALTYVGDKDIYSDTIDALRARLAMPESEPVACVYKATTKKGKTAHFGEYSAAKAWAGWGSVERIHLTTLTLVEKTKKTCGTCEALARTVMLDQTSHDRHKREWVGLTDDEIDKWNIIGHESLREFVRAIEAKLEEKNK